MFNFKNTHNMKKNLLLMGAMLGIVAVGNAQNVSRSNVRTNNLGLQKVEVSSMNHELNFSKSLKKASAPRKSRETGVYYKRPAGSYYLGSYNSYGYLVEAPFTDMKYVNMCADKTNSVWTVDGEAVDAESVDADGNYIGFYQPTSGVYYVPTLTSGKYSYYYGETMPAAQAGYLNQGVIVPDSIYEMTQVDLSLGGNYSGFSDGRVYGTNSITQDGKTYYCDELIEFFEKPARPFCLTSLILPFVTDSSAPLAPGKLQHVKFHKINEEGQMTEELITEMIITSANVISSSENGGTTFGYLEVSNTETDAMGTEISVPVIIDEPFILTIDGFAQEGVDYQLRMTSVGDTEDIFDEETGEGIEPTLMHFYDAEGKHVGYLDEAWTNDEGEKLQFNAIFYFAGMFDVVDFDDPMFKELTAPVEGGECYAESDGNYYNCEVFTTLPWISEWQETEGEENYYFENVPSWITVGEIDSQPWEKYKAVIIPFTAEALPEGMEGRKAEFNLVSDRGANLPIVIVQGNAPVGPATAISSVEATSNNNVLFNVMGQRVNENQKGIMINKGKKFVVQ